MFGKKEDAAFARIDTLIGKDANFRGVLQAEGTVRIEGSFQGEVNSQSDVVVGETGKLEANVKARNILVAGYVRGNIETAGKIELASTGKLFGDVHVSGLVIEEGGVFHGNCQMGKIEQEDKLENMFPKGVHPVA